MKILGGEGRASEVLRRRQALNIQRRRDDRGRTEGLPALPRRLGDSGELGAVRKLWVGTNFIFSGTSKCQALFRASRLHWGSSRCKTHRTAQQAELDGDQCNGIGSHARVMPSQSALSMCEAQNIGPALIVCKKKKKRLLSFGVEGGDISGGSKKENVSLRGGLFPPKLFVLREHLPEGPSVVPPRFCA